MPRQMRTQRGVPLTAEQRGGKGGNSRKAARVLEDLI